MTLLPTPIPGPVYALDIETTGLDSTTDRVISAAVYSPFTASFIFDADERWILARLLDLLASVTPGTVVTWNGACFDGPFIARRIQALGMHEVGLVLSPDPTITPKYEPQPGFDPIGYHPLFRTAMGGLHRHVDIAYTFRAWGEQTETKWSLKPVARALGIPVIEVDAEHTDELTIPELAAYNLSDVYATWRLAIGEYRHTAGPPSAVPAMPVGESHLPVPSLSAAGDERGAR